MYEVRRRGEIHLVLDRAALVRLVRVGQVRPEDGVRPAGEGPFRPARELPELAPHFDLDPFDVWEALDGRDPEELWEELTEPARRWAFRAPDAGGAPPSPREDPPPEGPDPGEGKEARRPAGAGSPGGGGASDAAPRGEAPPGGRPHDRVAGTGTGARAGPEGGSDGSGAGGAAAGRPPRLRVAFIPPGGDRSGRSARRSPPAGAAPARGGRPAPPSPPADAPGPASRAASPPPSRRMEGRRSRPAPRASRRPSGGSGGQVIAFPGRDLPVVPVPAERRKDEVPPRLDLELGRGPAVVVQADRGPNWMGLFLVTCAAVLVALAIWNVRTQATWTAPPPVAGADAQGEPAAEPAPGDEGDATPLSEEAGVLDPLVEELKDRMRRGVRQLGGDPDDLSNALLIELSRLRVDVVDVEAPVITWADRRHALPDLVEVDVRLRTRGELEREITAVALVVGKYVHYYGMTVDRFQVTLQKPDGTLLRRDLNAERARDLYRGRLDLVRFLTEG